MAADGCVEPNVNSLQTENHQITVIADGENKNHDCVVDLDSRIIRQVEYYFGDINLMKDRFMQSEFEKDEGWLPLSLLLTFKRLQALTTDTDVVINALKKSESGLLEIDEEAKKVRRSPSVPLPRNKTELNFATQNRTVFVEGFPTELTLNQLVDFFVQYGFTDNVQMRRVPGTKTFSGSVFVTFATEEAAKVFLQNSDLKYENYALKSELLDTFRKRKAAECQLTQKEQKRFGKTDKPQTDENKVDDSDVTNRMIPGSVVYLKGLPDTCTREKLKEKFGDFSKVYADFDRGDPEAWLRLNEPNTAKDVLQKVLDANSGKIEIDGVDITDYKVLEGDEEFSYWKQTVSKAKKRHREHKMNKFQNKKGKRQRKACKDGDNENDDQCTKKPKLDTD